jgi:hypothetical protein
VRLNVNQLDQLEIQPIPGLEHTGHSIIVQFGPTGTTWGITDQVPNLKPIGDAIKLAQAPRIARAETTLQKKEDNVDKTRSALFKIEQKTSKKNLTPSSNFLSELIKADQYASSLERNFDAIKSNTNVDSTSQLAKKILCALIRRSIASINERIESLSTGAEAKSFRTTLLEHGVPAWAWKKLALAILQIPPTANLMRIFFPQDATKGITLTVQEIRDKQVTDLLSEILRNSGLLIEAMRSDQILLHLAKIDLRGKEISPEMEKLLGLPIYVIPIYDQREYIRTVKMVPRETLRGTKMELVEKFNVLVLEAFAAMPSINREEIFSMMGLQIDRSITERPREQLVRQLEKVNLLSPDRIEQMLATIDPEMMKIIYREKLDHNKILSQKPPDEAFAAWSFKRPYMLVPLTREEKLALEKRLSSLSKVIPSPKVKQRNAQPLSLLTRASKDLIDFLKENRHSSDYIQMVSDYLRSFSSKSFQDAAVSIIEARVSNPDLYEWDEGEDDENYYPNQEDEQSKPIFPPKDDEESIGETPVPNVESGGESTD